jgi:hypothetical protein
MKKNMGKLDRAIRTVLAILFIASYALGFVSGLLGSVVLVLAVVFLLTSVISFCPLYTLLGLTTCKSEK